MTEETRIVTKEEYEWIKEAPSINDIKEAISLLTEINLTWCFEESRDLLAEKKKQILDRLVRNVKLSDN